MRQKLTTALEVAGAGMITAGASWLSRPVGVIVGGALCIAAGYLLAGDR